MAHPAAAFYSGADAAVHVAQSQPMQANGHRGKRTWSASADSADSEAQHNGLAMPAQHRPARDQYVGQVEADSDYELDPVQDEEEDLEDESDYSDLSLDRPAR